MVGLCAVDQASVDILSHFLVAGPRPRPVRYQPCAVDKRADYCLDSEAARKHGSMVETMTSLLVFFISSPAYLPVVGEDNMRRQEESSALLKAWLLSILPHPPVRRWSRSKSHAHFHHLQLSYGSSRSSCIIFCLTQSSETDPPPQAPSRPLGETSFRRLSFQRFSTQTCHGNGFQYRIAPSIDSARVEQLRFHRRSRYIVAEPSIPLYRL